MKNKPHPGLLLDSGKKVLDIMIRNRSWVPTTHRSIKCNPLAVSTTPEIWPGLSAKDASSNSFCMSPRPK